MSWNRALGSAPLLYNPLSPPGLAVCPILPSVVLVTGKPVSIWGHRARGVPGPRRTVQSTS